MKQRPPEGEAIRSRVFTALLSSAVLRPLISAVSLAGSVAVARILGASRLGFVAASVGLAAFVASIGDLGLSGTIALMLADAEKKGGRKLAQLTAYSVGVARVAATALVGLAVLAAAASGTVGRWEALPLVFIFLGVLRAVAGALAAHQQGVASAAFKQHAVNVAQLATSCATPILAVAAAAAGSTELVVLSGALVTALQAGWLAWKHPYDLGSDDAGCSVPPGWRVLWEYRKYLAVNLLKQFFRRSVFRFPLVLLLLGAAGAAPSVVANASIATTVAIQALSLVTMPLSGLRGPLAARFLAMGELDKLKSTQRALAGLLVGMSGVVAWSLMVVGRPLLSALYGPQYAEGIAVGVPAGLILLAANVFCLGNVVLQQAGRFTLQLMLLASTGAMVLPAALMGIGKLGVWVVAFPFLLRAIFWLGTDLHADVSVIQSLEALPVKLFGATSIVLLLIAENLVSRILWLCLFLVLWKLAFGGVGEEARRVLHEMLPQRLKKLAALV